MRRILPRAAFVSAVLAGAAAACSASNGDAVPREVLDAAPVEAGIGPDPEAGANDAPAETATDGGDGATGPVIVINEVYVDVTGSGGSQSEYIELRGTPNMPLGDLRLRRIAANGSVRENEAGDIGDTMPSSGVWVVGGATLPGAQIANHIIGNAGQNGWGLDTLAAVQLVRATTLLDVVGWSDQPDAGLVTAPSTPPTAIGEGQRVILPTAAGKSIGRRPAGADTNDNLADFCRLAVTPRVANSSTCDP